MVLPVSFLHVRYWRLFSQRLFRHILEGGKVVIYRRDVGRMTYMATPGWLQNS